MEGLQHINHLDYGILALLGISIILGIIRGFVREAMSLITWITSIVLAILYCETVASWLTRINLVGLRILIAFLSILLVSLIVGGLISYVIGKLIRLTGFGVTDRIIGTLFGIARGAVVISLVVLIVTPTPFSKDNLWQESILIPRFQPMSEWIKSKIPEELLQKVQF